jgi:hypothetical protein
MKQPECGDFQIKVRRCLHRIMPAIWQRAANGKSTRQNFGDSFKAKIALAAIVVNKAVVELAQQLEVYPD